MLDMSCGSKSTCQRDCVQIPLTESQVSNHISAPTFANCQVYFDQHHSVGCRSNTARRRFQLWGAPYCSFPARHVRGHSNSSICDYHFHVVQTDRAGPTNGILALLQWYHDHCDGSYRLWSDCCDRRCHCFLENIGSTPWTSNGHHWSLLFLVHARQCRQR